MDYPLSNTPVLHRIYGTLARHLQHRYNQINNTAQAWAYDTETISVVADTDTYTLSSTNFGKPLSVVSYSTDDGHIERQIPFFEVANLTFDWNAPRNAAAGYWQLDSTSTFSAERVAFYRDGGTDTVKLIFRPLPKATATYKVLYSIGDWVSSATLTDTPLLVNFHYIYELSTALALLPSARWTQDEEANKVKRNELMQSLSGELAMFLPTWDTYISDQVHATMAIREACYDV